MMKAWKSVVLWMCMAACVTSYAQVPERIHYQGRIREDWRIR